MTATLKQHGEGHNWTTLIHVLTLSSAKIAPRISKLFANLDLLPLLYSELPRFSCHGQYLQQVKFMQIFMLLRILIFLRCRASGSACFYPRKYSTLPISAWGLWKAMWTNTAQQAMPCMKAPSMRYMRIICDRRKMVATGIAVLSRFQERKIPLQFLPSSRSPSMSRNIHRKN